MNNVNAVQKKMVNDMRNGLLPIPKNHNEAAQLMTDVLVAVDHESNEKEFMDKCLSKIVRTYFSLCKDQEQGVYLSRLKNQMVRLNYFKTLERMTGARNKDGFKLIYRRLISDGVARSDGTKIRMTEDAKKLIGVCDE